MNRGYSRCSTNEGKQDINRQVRELKAAGAEVVYMEYEHGDAKVKSQQQAMFAESEAGDTIIVLEVSRLARSTQQLCEIIEIIRAKHLRLVIVGSITLDCRNGQADPMSEAFLQMAGVFSQLELSMIRARVRSGMENAKAKGKQIGRPPVTADDVPSGFLRHYPAYKRGQLNVSELARVCNISRTTAYKYIGLVNPYKMLIDNGFFYLLTYNGTKTIVYRIDRMKEVKELLTAREWEKEFKENVDMDNYTKRVFSMFGGKRERVTIRFIDQRLDTVVDQFGIAGVKYEKIDDTHFTAQADVEISDMFYSWVCGFGRRAKIIDPPHVVEGMREFVKKVSDMYEPR